jgi:multiple sugar transport system substrate-binding protein
LAAKLGSIYVNSAPGGHIPAVRIPTILDSMKFARPLRPLKNMTQYYNIETNDLYDPILLGTMNAKQAAQKAESALNALVK